MSPSNFDTPALLETSDAPSKGLLFDQNISTTKHTKIFSQATVWRLDQ